MRDVAAHLTLRQTGLLDGLRQLLRSPGGMNRVIRRSAVLRASTPTGQMVAEIRGMVGSRRHNVGVTCRETLIDQALAYMRQVLTGLTPAAVTTRS
ncbi:hypothetical protein [Frankia nepalensis]|uniref:hypothetical protein n=1 Tax=Frankia nepalensis TaxID=1836974 RepID=UPI001EE3CE83|nr:hypothetical protein [Frankia nepalensis]